MSKRSIQADQVGESKRTEVFISATSGDLRTVREMVKQGLLTMGCFPIEQTNFEPDYRTVREMLETRIAKCDAVIHIVGVRYGAEPDPASVPEGQTRRSYTQMEAEIARELGKKLYIFLCPEDFPYDQDSPAEGEEKRELQRAYRQQVAGRDSLHTPIRSREEIAVKVRELKFELEKLKGTIAHDRARTFAVLVGLLLALAFISTGVWWWVAHGPQATAEKVAGQFRYDRSTMREQLATEIRAQAQKRIASLNQAEDWRKINEIEKGRDQQIADLDRFLDGIEQTSKEGEASESYLTASKLLQEKGVGEALAFLEAKSSQREKLIEAQKNRRDREEKEMRKLLQEELLAASLLEKQLRFKEAENKYRRAVNDAGLWAEPRNALAGFLIERGIAVEPLEGNVKLREAEEICQGTLAFNQRGKSPQDWAQTQNNLGIALEELGERSSGEKSRKLLDAAVAAYRFALEVRTKADLPQDWAQTQNNLGIVLAELGKRSSGEEGRKLLEDAVAAYRSALEVDTKTDLPQDWARTQNNLGIALEELGKHSSGKEGRELPEAAIAAYRSALEVRTKADLPFFWADTQNNLGTALLGIGMRSGGEEGRKLLEDAVAAFHCALEVKTKADLPQDWARTQNNLGIALLGIGMRSGGEEGRKLFDAAVAAYHSALEVYTKADLPQDWARTQNNLSKALFFLGATSGGEEGRKMLEDSAAACRSALEVDAGADRPQDRAVTQTILTSALLYLGASSGGEESRKTLENTVAEYRSALAFYTEADRSEDWAMTQNMLGVALLGLGTSGSGEESRKVLEEAVAACRSALEVYTKADVPQFWALTQLNLSLALLELGNRGGGNEESRKMLEEAVAACRSVLEVHTKADLPQFWTMTQNCLALGLWALGGQLKGEEGLKHRRESVEPLREVVAYQPDDSSRYQLATRLGSFAFYLILHRQFAEAQKRCEEAQALTKNIGDGIEKTDRDDLIFIQMNRAHALLFQGHYDEALAIYSQYWDKPLHGNTFGEVTLKDFAVFDKAGLTHPDLLRMKRTLGDLHSKAHSP